MSRMTGASRGLALAFAIALTAVTAYATDYVSYQSGPWGSTSTWEPAGIPDSATDNVTINHSVAVDGSYIVNNLTIGSGGTLTCGIDQTLWLFGAWTNNGAATLTNGSAEFVGSSDGQISGSVATTFYRLIINKDALADQVVLQQNVAMTCPALGSLNVSSGTLVTNGKDLDADVVNSVVTGNAQGKLTINGASTVDIWMLQQDYLGYILVADSATLNVSSWQFTMGTCKFEVTGGAVNYTQSSGWNFRIFGQSPPGFGYIVTGGTITFYGDVVASVWSNFDVSGTGVIRFAGNSDSRFDLMNAFGGVGWAHWVLNDLRIEKTGGAAVRITASGTTTMDTSVVIQTGVTIGPDAVLILNNPLFNGTFGFIINNIVNQGTLIDSNYTYVTGNWVNNGTFRHGANLITFQGPGTGTLAAGENGFYYDVKVDKPAGTLYLAGDCRIEHNLTLLNGALVLTEDTLILGTGSTSATAAVNGGEFSPVNSDSWGPTIAPASDDFPYRFEVTSGGAISARYAKFCGMDTGGIKVWGTVNATDNFSRCTFDHGALAGRMLKIESSQTIDDITGASFIGSAGANVEKLGASGHLRFDAGGGTRWGEDFDNDPNNLIDWGQSGVALDPCPGTSQPAFSVGPSPLTYGVASVRYSLPAVGAALPRLCVYDATGRQVGVWKILPPGKSGNAELDLRSLPDGLYLVRLSAGAWTGTQKLVTQR